MSTSSAPLSLAQRRIWLLDQLDPGNPAYNVLSGRRISGALDEAALVDAIRAVVLRHEPLRAVFSGTPGEPRQSAVDEVPQLVEVADLTPLRPPAREKRLHDVAARLGKYRFDLTRELPIRVFLGRTGREEHVLYVLFHHIVMDGWSLAVFYSDVIEFYAALRAGRLPRLPDITTSYFDFATRQRAEAPLAWAPGVEFWRQKLSGLPPMLNLPADRPRPPVPSYRGGYLTFDLGERLTAAIRTFAAGAGATPFTVLLAGLQAVLARYSGEEHFAIGVPVAGRDEPELDPLVGLFINTIAVPAVVGSNPTFAETVRRVRGEMLEVLEHQDVPIELVLERLGILRDLSFNPLYQVMLAFNNTPGAACAAAGLELLPLDLDPGSAKLDITLNVTEVDRVLRCDLYYAADLFDEPRMRRFAGHFRQVLAHGIASPGCRIGDVSLLTTAERAKIAGWNRTGRAYPAATLPQLLQARIAATPEAPAVWADGEWLTYAGLGRKVNALAEALRASGAGPGDVIGVFLPRSADLVVTLHAIHAIGAAYLPLVPDLPDARVATLVRDAAVRLVVTSATLAGRLPPEVTPAIASAALPGQPSTLGVTPVHPDSLAYVIHTSGSTGKPKAIGISHRAITNRLHWMQEAFALAPTERLIQKTPLGFDVSVWEFFWPVIAGAGLVVAAPDGHRDPGYLAGLLRDHGVSTVHFVPSMLGAFLDEPDLSSLSRLRRVICSGEELSRHLVRRFARRLPHCELHNLYGPTEAAVDVSWHRCSPASPGPVPIGRPVANTRLSIRDNGLAATPIGVPGELCISGVQLAWGYLGNPGLTAGTFVPDPAGPAGTRMYRTGDLARWGEDGEIEFLGRIDHQVKLNGQRIEPGEVESVLRSSPLVQEAAVVLATDGPAPRLIAYVVLAGRLDEQVAGKRLTSLAADHLPGYMVPSRIVCLPAMPTTASGKLNLAELPAPPVSAALPSEPPRTPAEIAVVTGVRESLGVPDARLPDNFFALGGDSIRGLKLIARLRAAGYQLTLKDLFRSRDLSGLAAALAPCVPVPEPEPAPFSLVSPADLALMNHGGEQPR